MAAIQDRIRIPWRGGAKQLQLTTDALTPIILVPCLLSLAAFDYILAILILIICILFFTSISNWFLSNNPRTKFFVLWAVMSILCIAFIFELKVIALLEILPEENIWLGLLFAVFCGLVYVVKSRAPKFKVGSMEEVANQGEDFCITCRKKVMERMHHCQICQVCVPERDLHFFWFDCCIGQTNNGFFMLALLFGIISLLYSSNLTLTTVCHPFTAIGTVMLPDDCSEVYEQYDMSLCFVSAVYSIILAVYLLWILVKQCIYISLGVTGQEWAQMPLVSKIFCGWGTKRIYSDGFFRNWYTLLFYANKMKAAFDT